MTISLSILSAQLKCLVFGKWFCKDIVVTQWQRELQRCQNSKLRDAAFRPTPPIVVVLVESPCKMIFVSFHPATGYAINYHLKIITLKSNKRRKIRNH